MEISKLSQVLANKKRGTYTVVWYERELGNDITKLTKMVVRLGVNYGHMRDKPQPKTNRVRQDNSIILNKEFNVKQNNGKTYILVAKSYSPFKVKSEYYQNGNMIDRETAIAISGEKPSNHDALVLSLNVDNIIEIM